MRSLTPLFLSLVSAGLVRAAALPSLIARDVTALSADALSAITPFAHFAAAAYCPSNTVKDWGCGGEGIALLCLWRTLILFNSRCLLGTSWL